MMKKLTLFIVALLAIGFSAKAGDYLEVKEGTIEVWDHIHYQFYFDAYYEVVPTNFYVAHTGAQLLYTPDLLSDLEGKQNVRITELGFRLHNKAFDNISRVVMIYLQEVDATEFAVNGAGVKQFFDLGTCVMGDLYQINLGDYYSQDVDMDFFLAMNDQFYFTPGKSLLVTIVFDVPDNYYNYTTSDAFDVTFYKSCVGQGKAMSYTNDLTSFVHYAQSSDFPNATQGCGTDLDLPWTRITYEYTVGDEPTQSGDLDGDGEVTIDDVTELIDYLLSGIADGVNLDNADCDKDGEITITDVSMLIDYLLYGYW